MRFLIHQIVLLGFITALLAPACGFAWGGQFSVIEICTEKGIEHKIIADAQNNEAPSSPAYACQFCFQQMMGQGFQEAFDFITVPITFTLTVKRFSLALYYQSTLDQSRSPRGPPSIV